ncbi:MAG TPA: glycosyltransferase [Rhodanobacteraceae bacterium]|jgi:GT2 family glycosyltransferase/SAM-dependent methyltransferase/glycosyltransferase involved in cell wall biosynthesis|nr:glycosyltransferase [Rhodanobacteraceae bacterium]
MKFTGERYIPGEGGDIRQEHLHRYAWCRHLAAGRRVLDIACGEGYGSAMLAQVAVAVMGVDIAEEAVAHALATYGALAGLEFRVGDAARIPLEDASVDLVVSFETIEHHARHAEMLSEIRRVLRPDGLLVISSPNRDVYAARAGYHNEYHVKELDLAEFDAVLRVQFPAIRYFGQRLAVGSSIFPLVRDAAPTAMLAGFTDTGNDVVERAGVLPDPIYYIAVASEDPARLPETLGPSVLQSEAEDLYDHHLKVAAWARQLDAESSQLRERYAEAVRGGEEVSGWAKAMQHEAAQLRERYVEAVRGGEEVSGWAKALQREAAAAETARQAAEQQVETQSRWLAERQAQIDSLSGELAERERQIENVRSELIDARGEVVRSRARLRQLEQDHTLLELIKASRSWRWTRPWRLLARTVRGRGVGATDRKQLRRWLRRHRGAPAEHGPRVLAQPLAEGPAHVAPPDTARLPAAPAPQAPGRRDFFFWAVIDWHFRIQRPQQLARGLANAGHRVFYISNNFVDDARPGFAVEPLDTEGRLYQVHLHLRGAPQIYHAAPDPQQQAQLRASIGELLAWTDTRGCVSLVQHPYWLEAAHVLPGSWLAYDCMDHHGGFADNGDGVLAREAELMREADLLVVTSDWLYEEAGRHNPRRLMVRNACEYDHFAHGSAQPFTDVRGRKVIGYYGAIAEWFDLDLVEKVARRFADCLVLLVGNDTAGAHERLAHLDNVKFTSEVPYAELPAYLDGFDVCMLPFQVIPLTLATNPVKVYEYLSAGKNVVSVALPEIRQFGELVRIADNHAAFLDAIVAALSDPPSAQAIERRQRFAAEQTWAHRVDTLLDGIAALRGPKVSVIVVTYNNLELTRVCLDSLERLSDYANMEVIVVDNASADDTPTFLCEWAAGHADRRVILNDKNLGFAAGNNVGLAAASGDYLVMLNNDTHVTPGWAQTLMAHLRRDAGLGMIGPVTNNIGNEARIEIEYADMQDMLARAAAYTAHHAGQEVPLRTAAFFCVMMPRAVYEKVGPLDEAFGIGFFEDDDYCRRVEAAGWRVACAEDVFIHHHLSASFNKLKQESRQALFERNKAIYEAKWGPWVPHKYRGH